MNCGFKWISQQVSTKDKDPSDRVKSLLACKGSQELGWGDQLLGFRDEVNGIQKVGTGGYKVPHGPLYMYGTRIESESSHDIIGNDVISIIHHK
jgi:hypothetical protein